MAMARRLGVLLLALTCYCEPQLLATAGTEELANSPTTSCVLTLTLAPSSLVETHYSIASYISLQRLGSSGVFDRGVFPSRAAFGDRGGEQLTSSYHNTESISRSLCLQRGKEYEIRLENNNNQDASLTASIGDDEPITLSDGTKALSIKLAAATTAGSSTSDYSAHLIQLQAATPSPTAAPSFNYYYDPPATANPTKAPIVLPPTYPPTQILLEGNATLTCLSTCPNFDEQKWDLNDYCTFYSYSQCTDKNGYPNAAAVASYSCVPSCLSLDTCASTYCKIFSEMTTSCYNFKLGVYELTEYNSTFIDWQQERCMKSYLSKFKTLDYISLNVTMILAGVSASSFDADENAQTSLRSGFNYVLEAAVLNDITILSYEQAEAPTMAPTHAPTRRPTYAKNSPTPLPSPKPTHITPTAPTRSPSAVPKYAARQAMRVSVKISVPVESFGFSSSGKYDAYMILASQLEAAYSSSNAFEQGFKASAASYGTNFFKYVSVVSLSYEPLEKYTPAPSAAPTEQFTIPGETNAPTPTALAPPGTVTNSSSSASSNAGTGSSTGLIAGVTTASVVVAGVGGTVAYRALTAGASEMVKVGIAPDASLEGIIPMKF